MSTLLKLTKYEMYLCNKNSADHMGEVMLSDIELISRVRLASSLAYAPYSNFQVGTILEATNGQIFIGCNVENASYGLCICAERTAVVKAVSSEVKAFSRVTVFA